MVQKRFFLSLLFASLIQISYGQKSSKSFLSLKKIGIQFTQGNENNIFFDDLDYFYRTQTIKGQLYYPITHLKSIEISLVVQPQYQLVQHQLYNEYFVKPTVNNYLEKRQQYLKLKNLSISAVEFSLEAKQKMFKHASIFLQIGLGLGYIDTDTERLAKGFTFLENVHLGFEFELNSKTSFQFFGGIGHVSNLNFQMPNSGYSTFNSGFGFQYSLY